MLKGMVGAEGHPGAQQDIAHLSLGHRLETPALSDTQSYRQRLLWLNPAVDTIQYLLDLY